jgi:hypothetical protein
LEKSEMEKYRVSLENELVRLKNDAECIIEGV